MTTRELKVSELNRILPLVRETLKKEKELKALREYANSLRHQINNIKQGLGKEDISKVTTNLFISRYIEHLKECKKQIEETENYIAASNLLFEGFSQMFNYGLLNCYINGGVLEVSELNEEFIYEYAYLIQNTSSLTVYRLLSIRPEVMKKVESSMYTAELPTRKKIRDFLRLVIKFDKLLKK